MINLLLSGGAVGADTEFGIQAIKVGHQAQHFGFQGQKFTPETQNYRVILNEIQLHESDEWLKKANKILKRSFPCRSIYVTNLLHRNYYQVKTTERVYAITPLDNMGLPQGGTGWAVTMAVLLKVPEIYVYDCVAHNWFEFGNFDEKNNIMYWFVRKEQPPTPHGTYTGIGSVEITDEGREAIRKLYVS